MRHNKTKVLINPVVISKEGHTKYWKACPSCLDNMDLVNRPYKMLVHYYDTNDIEQSETFERFEATVLSHESDYLDDILHME